MNVEAFTYRFVKARKTVLFCPPLSRELSRELSSVLSIYLSSSYRCISSNDFTPMKNEIYTFSVKKSRKTVLYEWKQLTFFTKNDIIMALSASDLSEQF